MLAELRPRCRTPKGDYFVKASTRRGILPEILDELLSARKNAKKVSILAWGQCRCAPEPDISDCAPEPDISDCAPEPDISGKAKEQSLLAESCEVMLRPHLVAGYEDCCAGQRGVCCIGWAAGGGKLDIDAGAYKCTVHECWYLYTYRSWLVLIMMIMLPGSWLSKLAPILCMASLVPRCALPSLRQGASRCSSELWHPEAPCSMPLWDV